MSRQKTILITSVGSGVGYGVLHALRRANSHYRIIGANCDAVAAGNFRCDRVYQLPAARDAQPYFEALDSVLCREHPDLLIPGHDLELPLLAARRHELEQRHGVRVMVSSPEVIRICNDKLASARFIGEPFVPTAGDAGEIAQLISTHGFPLLVKPRFGYASHGVRVVFDRAELLATQAESRDELVVQEFIAPPTWTGEKVRLTRADVSDGDRLRQEGEYSVQMVVGEAERVLGIFASRNTLVHGVPFTVETLRDEALEAMVLEMTSRLSALGLVGPCNFQARLTAQGRFAFFEINARFTGITPVRADMGFNECDAVYRHFVDGEAAPPLHCEPGQWAQRYIAHDVFDASDLATLRRTGTWPAST